MSTVTIDGSTNEVVIETVSNLAAITTLQSQVATLNTNTGINGNVDRGDVEIESTGTDYKVTGLRLNITTITAAATSLDSSHSVILANCASNNVQLDLPDASTNSGRVYHVKKIDSSVNTVTIDGLSAQTIDGSATAVISTQWDSLTIVSNGVGWYIL